MENRKPTGRPSNAPATLKELYQQTTGQTAHQRAIHGRFLHQAARTRRIVAARLKGQTLRSIAEKEGVKHGTVQTAITRAMEAIRKSIAGESRYNRTSRDQTSRDREGAEKEGKESGPAAALARSPAPAATTDSAGQSRRRTSSTPIMP